MKKTIISFICLVMFSTVFTGSTLAFASSENAFKSETFVSSIFLKNNSVSAEQWYSEKDTRAFFTLLTAVELTKHYKYTQEDLLDYVSNPSWVGISKSKSQLMSIGYIIASSTTTIWAAMLNTKTSEIQCLKIDINGSDSQSITATVESMIPIVFDSQDATLDYCQNDPDEMMSAYKTIYDNQ